jgi:hypothetical protein
MDTTEYAPMSTGIPAIARAYDDEPIPLRIVGYYSERAAEVMGTHPVITSAYPRKLLFAADAGLLDALRDAYNRDDRNMLAHLWAKATPAELRAGE